ncbi:MAG: hypothetical protein J0I69_04860 [Altererythrobacter sp.]|mgnify:CR=1 FL=1|nr:hypothetical protein [Altererythrobacter sp.]
MLMGLTLLVVGFLAGVALTALVAFHIYGLLHAEAVRAVESYGVVLFSANATGRAARQGHVHE